MLDLSAALAQFRVWCLPRSAGRLASWPVLHVIAKGPTLAENYRGVGPWARIWALPSRVRVILPMEASKPYVKEVSYIVALFVPRVLTTDSIIESILHEYLHIGVQEGTLLHHGFNDELAFTIAASNLASDLVKDNDFCAFAPLFMSSWSEMRSQPVCGLTLPEIETQQTPTFDDPLQPHYTAFDTID